ncbi:outer membrane protein assembly factor BamA [Persephonella sp.]|nr:outer membrane protein assembly factor BamA [Persephonella sp.]
MNVIGGLIPLFFILFILFSPISIKAQENNQNLKAGSLAEEVNKIYRLRKVEIKGLKYVNPQLIYPLITIGKGAIVTRDNVAQIIRDLYKLGYFQDIEAYTRYTENGIDLIFVFKELPVVQKIEFEGNEEISDEDLLQVLGIMTKERTESGMMLPFSTIGPELADKLASIRRGLGRVFSPDEINKMIQAIKKKYEKEGFYNVKVSYYFKGSTLVFKIDEGQRAYIAKIDIVGNKQLEDDEIKDVMETKERSIWKLRFHPRLQKDVLLEDIERIRDLYIKKGFFEVQIDKPEIKLKNGEEYYITIKIHEGPRYRLSGIEFKNNNYYTDEELIKKFKDDIKIGDYYNGEIIERIKKEVTNKYTDLGFIFAMVFDEKVLDKKAKKVKVVYDIQPGKVFYVDKIDISGNYESRDYVIRRELRFAPGDLFKRQSIYRSQSRLYALGFYDAIGFDPHVKEQEGKIDVDVKVKERFTGQISVGAGYSQLTGFSAFLSLRKGNFLGTGDTAGISITIGSDYRNNSISYLHRWAFYKPVDLGFNLYDRYVDYTTFVSEKQGFSPTLSWELSEYWRIGTGITIERGKYKDITEDAPYRIKAQAGSYSLVATYLNLSRSDIDNPILPTRGSNFSITFKVGYGTRGFYKAAVSYSKIFPDEIFYTDWILSLKGRYGIVEKMKDKIPLDEYFFVGGDFTIRGFDYGMAGPYDSNKDPIGSKQQIIFNAQLSHPIAEKFLWGYIFTDMGKGYDNGNPFDNWFYSVGGGIKIVTPMAPIDIYYGKVLNAPAGVSDSRIGFVLGTFF